MTAYYKIIANGDSALTIIFTDPISQNLSRKIMALTTICQQKLTPQVTEYIPAYQSLTLCYKPNKISFEQLHSQVTLLLQSPLPLDDYQSKNIVIPVCYEDEFAIDLNHVVKHSGLSKQDVIRTHSQTEYFVHMLGFSPGFLYLGGLKKQLTCPRKASPSLSVPAGSVGIGGNQTGIYPQTSPGGWHIIGRTPLPLFDINKDSPCIASPLDIVTFTPISSERFVELSQIQS